MNRVQRRTKTSEKYEPLGLIFRCPGVDGEGCPTSEIMSFALGHKATEGLSGEALSAICEKSGWTLAVAKLPQPALEPVCKECGQKILLRIMEGGIDAVLTSARTKKETLIDETTKMYLKRLLGPGLPE